MRNLCFSSGIEKEKKKQMKQFIQRGKKIRSKIQSHLGLLIILPSMGLGAFTGKLSR